MPSQLTRRHVLVGAAATAAVAAMPAAAAIAAVEQAPVKKLLGSLSRPGRRPAPPLQSAIQSMRDIERYLDAEATRGHVRERVARLKEITS
jgi:hypothetical protein